MSVQITQKPYFVRALWEWCLNEGYTPHIMVHVDEHTRVPAGYARDGQIVLDISADATQGLDIDNKHIVFQARFGGVAQQLYIPMGCVLAIFSAETSEGMSFEYAASDATGVDDERVVDTNANVPEPAKKTSSLKLVK